MNKKRYHCFIIIVPVLLFVACYDKDIGNIEDEVNYHAEFSIPVGEDLKDMERIVEGYYGDLIEIPDIFIIPDTLHVFYYNNIHYYIRNGLTTFDFESTKSVDLSSTDEKNEYITSAMIRTNTINRIPATVYAQVYFLDANYELIDSLYYNGWLRIEAAKIDSLGQVLEPSELWKKDVVLSEQLIARLPEISYVKSFTRLILNNFIGTNIQYVEDQDIWIQLALRFKLDMPLNEL